MQLLAHNVFNWRETAMHLLDGRGGHDDAVSTIRRHDLLLEPDEQTDEAILRSLIGKVNATPFMDCDAESLLCVNSGRGFGPTPDEWTVILYERAGLRWNEGFEPAGGGKQRKVRAEDYGAADFATVLGNCEN